MTDFERILYLTRYVKLLKEDIANRDFKIGELTSEIDELKADNDRLVAKLCLIKIKDA